MMPTVLTYVSQSLTPATGTVSQFWPTTVVGWITVVGFAASVLVAVFTGGKVWGKILSIEATIAEQFKAQDKKFANLLTQHERDVTQAMNGLGARVSIIEDAERHREGMFDAIRQFMSNSSEDRKLMRQEQQHMRAAIEAIMADIRDYRRETAEREREGRKEAIAREERLMEAIRDMRRG